MSDSVRPHRQKPSRLPHPWDSPGKNTGVGCHFLLQCMKVKRESEVTPSCPTLSNLMDCSLPGSSIPGIFQARVLEWGAIAFSESGLQGLYNYINACEAFRKVFRAQGALRNTFRTDIRNSGLCHLLFSTWNSAQCYMAAWMRGTFGEEQITINVWQSPFSVHLKSSQHCSTPIQNKKFKKETWAFVDEKTGQFMSNFPFQKVFSGFFFFFWWGRGVGLQTKAIHFTLESALLRLPPC